MFFEWRIDLRVGGKNGEIVEEVSVIFYGFREIGVKMGIVRMERWGWSFEKVVSRIDRNGSFGSGRGE